jgi:hypothetical protein
MVVVYLADDMSCNIRFICMDQTDAAVVFTKTCFYATFCLANVHRIAFFTFHLRNSGFLKHLGFIVRFS